MDRLIPDADPEIVKPLARRIEKRYEKILTRTKVAKIEAMPAGLKVSFESADGGAEKAGIQVNDRGWIPVDRKMRSNVAHIIAIGDIVGEPMLAHGDARRQAPPPKSSPA